MASRLPSEIESSEELESQEPSDRQLRLVLVGKTRVGKSATGNSILGKEVFNSCASVKSITKACEKDSTTWKGREVVVLDTPGLFDTEVPDADTCREIVRCLILSSPGPHALLLVVPLGRYTQEEHKATLKVLTMFGDAARRSMILLFTRKDDLDGMELHDYLKIAPEGIRELMRKFEGRLCAFNNKAMGAEFKAQREQLLTLVQRMVTENGGGCYTNAMYQEAESEIQKNIQGRLEPYRKGLEREKALIREEFEEKIRKLENKVEQLEKRAEMERVLAAMEADFASRQRQARREVETSDGFLAKFVKGVKAVYEVLRVFL